MRNKGRGRGRSSSARGRGQNSSLHRTHKSASPAAKTPSILLTTADQTKIPLLPRSPIKTRASGKKTQQSELTSGFTQQQFGAGGPGPSSSKTGIISIPSSNGFATLSDTEDDDKSVQQQENNNTADDTRKAKLRKRCALPRVRDRPPLIHVVDTLAATVDELLIPPNIQYIIKVTKVSVQVLAVNQAEYDKVLEIFKANSIKYFTYDNRNTAPVKIVLQGLAEMEVSVVMQELKNLDFTPREVKVLSKKTTATGTHVLYLLYFDKGTVKIQDLRLVQCLFGYLVKWRFFTKRPTDAAQCHRCQKFGHGSRNCNLPPRCVKCGKDHLTEGCPLPRKATLKVTGNAEQHKPSVKCANCGGNHTANFRGCTFWKSYIEQQEKKKKSSPASSSPKPAASRSSTHPPGWSRTYASVAAAGLEPVPAPDDAADGDLFSLSEFLILARDMFQRLSSCRNKQQQFMALSELMIKYVCTV